MRTAEIREAMRVADRVMFINLGFGFFVTCQIAWAVDVADNEADWLHIHFITAPPSAQQRCQFTLSVLCFPLLMISFDEQFQPHNGPKCFCLCRICMPNKRRCYSFLPFVMLLCWLF